MKINSALLRSALCKQHAVIIDGALLIRRLRRHLPHRGRLEIACNFGLNEVRQSPLEKANSALCILHSALLRSALHTLHEQTEENFSRQGEPEKAKRRHSYLCQAAFEDQRGIGKFYDDLRHSTTKKSTKNTTTFV